MLWRSSLVLRIPLSDYNPDSAEACSGSCCLTCMLGQTEEGGETAVGCGKSITVPA